MTGNPVSVSVLALAGCLMGLGFLAVTGLARAQPVDASGGRLTAPVAGASGRLLDFDIPAQPLDSALSQYGLAIRQPVAYPSRIAGGRMSSAVRGRYTPEAALQLLLAGAGLVAEKIHTDAGDTFTLSETPDLFEAGRTTMPLLPPGTRAYSGQIQASILRVLCADPDTVPGRYASLLRFRLDAEGRVRDAQLLDSTGDPHRDTALLEALRHLRMATPPPPVLAGKPLTMAVLPRGADDTSQCRSHEEVG